MNCIHDPFHRDAVMRCNDCEELVYRVVKAAEEANVSHGVGCPAVFINPRPCECGLDELDVALAKLDAAGATNDDKNGADQHAE